MNTFTQVVWDVINEEGSEHEQLLTNLRTMMFKEYAPFLSEQQAFRVNTHTVKTSVLEHVEKWLTWLPDTPLSELGGLLAMEALSEVDWSDIALQLRLAHLVS